MYNKLVSSQPLSLYNEIKYTVSHKNSTHDGLLTSKLHISDIRSAFTVTGKTRKCRQCPSKMHRHRWRTHRRRPVWVRLCRAFKLPTHPFKTWRGRWRLLCFSLAIGVVHLTKRASTHSLEGEQGIVCAGVRRRKVFRMEVHLQLRAATNTISAESHKLVHRSLVWDGTSALHVRDLKACLRRDGCQVHSRQRFGVPLTCHARHVSSNAEERRLSVTLSSLGRGSEV